MNATRPPSNRPEAACLSVFAFLSSARGLQGPRPCISKSSLTSAHHRPRHGHAARSQGHALRMRTGDSGNRLRRDGPPNFDHPPAARESQGTAASTSVGCDFGTLPALRLGSHPACRRWCWSLTFSFVDPLTHGKVGQAQEEDVCGAGRRRRLRLGPSLAGKIPADILAMYEVHKSQERKHALG